MRRDLFLNLGFEILPYGSAHSTDLGSRSTRLMSFDLSVLTNDGLNLPEKLPHPSKWKGSGRLSKAAKSVEANTRYCGLSSVFKIVFRDRTRSLWVAENHNILRFDRKTSGSFSKSGLIIPYYGQSLPSRGITKFLARVDRSIESRTQWK